MVRVYLNVFLVAAQEASDLRMKGPALLWEHSHTLGRPRLSRKTEKEKEGEKNTFSCFTLPFSGLTSHILWLQALSHAYDKQVPSA